MNKVSPRTDVEEEWTTILVEMDCLIAGLKNVTTSTRHKKAQSLRDRIVAMAAQHIATDKALTRLNDRAPPAAA